METTFIVILLCTRSLIAESDVTFHDLNENPRLLPYKLGTTKILSNHLSLIQIYDLNPLIEEYISIRQQSSHLTNKITQDDSYNNEFINIIKSVTILEHRIENQIYQLNPLFNSSQRNKRGILNPLGSIIKCITGNLDVEDAKRYENQIEQLQSSESKLRVSVLNQVTLLESTINKFQNLLSNISHNEQLLESKIKYIENIIKKVTLQQTTTHEFYQFNIVLNQITAMYQTIYDIFARIEIAITFAKINTLHNAIINPFDLLNEINKFKPLLTNEILPLTVNLENILNIEQIITIKSYSKKSIITFILELPLVQLEIYQYFQLYPVPIPKKPHEFYTILPYKPFLALSNTKFAYMDQHCIQLQKDEYLCKEAHLVEKNDKSPCAVQLIDYQTNITTCTSFGIPIQEIQTTKIADGKWLITTPKEIVSTVTCGAATRNQPLYGSYLLESNTYCIVEINSIKLQTYKPTQLPFDNPPLPKLDLSLMDHQSIKFNPPTVDLNVINLKNTEKIKEDLILQREQLNQMSLPIQTRTSIWTIILYFILLTSVTIILSKYLYNKLVTLRKIKQNTSMNENIQNEIII